MEEKSVYTRHGDTEATSECLYGGGFLSSGVSEELQVLSAQ